MPMTVRIGASRMKVSGATHEGILRSGLIRSAAVSLEGAYAAREACLRHSRRRLVPSPGKVQNSLCWRLLSRMEELWRNCTCSALSAWYVPSTNVKALGQSCDMLLNRTSSSGWRNAGEGEMIL